MKRCNGSQLTAKKNAARRKADTSRIKAGGQIGTFVNS